MIKKKHYFSRLKKKPGAGENNMIFLSFFIFNYFSSEKKEAYANTERISLVSSFAARLVTHIYVCTGEFNSVYSVTNS